jgi:hypothetical protein
MESVDFSDVLEALPPPQVAAGSTDEALNPAIPVPADVLAFVAQHSEVYKAQHSDDSSVTVQGCLPSTEVMAFDEVISCLHQLVALHAEHESMNREEPFRICTMRKKGCLYRCLEGKDTEELLEKMKEVVRFLLLPKSLMNCLELVEELKSVAAAYGTAVKVYDPASATEPYPRFVDFLRESPAARARLAALAQSVPESARERYKNALGFELFRKDPLSVINTLDQAFADGIFGEDIEEYGARPGNPRAFFNAAGCVLVGTEVPYPYLPDPSTTDIDVMRAFSDRFSGKYFAGAGASPSRMAAAMGKLDLLKQLNDRFQSVGDDLIGISDAALEAPNNQLETLRWLHSLYPESFTSLHSDVSYSCVKGSLSKSVPPPVSEWLAVSLGLPGQIAVTADRNYADLAIAAAGGNRLDVLRFLKSRGVPLPSNLLEIACKHGNPEMLSFGRTNGANLRGNELSAALAAGHMAVYNLGLAMRLPREKGELAAACRGFKGTATTVLRQLLDAGAPSDKEAVVELAEEAGRQGRIPILELISALPSIVEAQAEVSLAALKGAIQGEKKECARWLLDPVRRAALGLPPSGLRPLPAVSFDPVNSWPTNPFDLELLELLHPFFEMSRLFREAIRRLDLPALRWLGAHDCSTSVMLSLADKDNPLLRLAMLGERGLPFLQVLVEHCGLDLSGITLFGGGADPRSAFTRAAARGGSVKVLKFQIKKLCLYNGLLLSDAASMNQVPMLRWLHKTAASWPLSKGLVRDAKQAGAEASVAWLLDNGAPAEDEELPRMCHRLWCNQDWDEDDVDDDDDDGLGEFDDDDEE